MTWSTFEAAAPDLASEGRRLMFRGETGEVLLATVRADAPPRIHPIYVEVVDGRLYAFILAGPKRADLEHDGRYALHTHVDPAEPSEFSVRGQASVVTNPERRRDVAEHWSFEVDDGYGLFEFDVEAAVLGSRPDPDAWPPRYTSWHAPG
jgi:hypothetical protein